MRGTYILVGMMVILLQPAVEAARIDDHLNSFSGYALEAPQSNYPSLRLIKTWSTEFVQEVGVYESPDEAITLNDVALQSGRYRFVDNRLESIGLKYEGRKNRDKLMEWIEEHYGKLSALERKMVNQVEWHGDRLSITLTLNVESGQGSLLFISPSLHHLINKTIYDKPPS